MYYEDGLFERFFDQALKRLAPGGRVVLVFSNLIELVQPDVPHPIQTELDRGRFALVETSREGGAAGRRAAASDAGEGGGLGVGGGVAGAAFGPSSP